MTIIGDIKPGIDAFIYSRPLKRTLSGLTDCAVARVDTASGPVELTTKCAGSVQPIMPATLPADRTPTVMIACLETGLAPADLAVLRQKADDRGSGRAWRAFRCRLQDGRSDLVRMMIPGDMPAERAEAVLTTVWPALREDCLADLSGAVLDGDDAVLSLVASMTDIGILVVNARGLILRANPAARRMMAEGWVLMRGCGGLHAVTPQQTHNLRENIKDCANGVAGGDDRIVIVDMPNTAQRVPVTLSRYWHDGAPTGLVTLVIPAPPDPARVERMARAMGLTCTEARVAAMLQLGLSNREAAETMGLKEQSFSTYAKRVLNKLNVRSRAEIAQMLTWQALGGKAS